jgi:hypothetical protein
VGSTKKEGPTFTPASLMRLLDRSTEVADVFVESAVRACDAVGVSATSAEGSVITLGQAAPTDTHLRKRLVGDIARLQVYPQRLGIFLELL